MPYARLMATRQPPEPGVTTALANLRRAYEQAADVISAMPGQRAFEAATGLADVLRELAELAAELRAQTAARIAEEEKLSLAVLATRIGVSKARAAQLVQSAQKAELRTTDKRETTRG